MALAITQEHRSLADVVRSFAIDHALLAQARRLHDHGDGGVADVLKQLAPLGWLGVHVPEDQGGAGFGGSELAVITEGLGYFVTPAPFLSTVIAVGVLGSAAVRAARPMAPLLDGTEVVGVGLSGRLTGTDRIDGDGGIVLAGRWADLLLLRVGTDIVIIEADRPGVTLEPVDGIDVTLGLTRVHCDEVSVTVDDRLAGAHEEALARLRAVCAAEAAGGARACLDMAVSYAKVREQFGRTIGSFQAVKHHLANMLVAVELATAVAWDAARVDDDRDQCRFAAACAGALAPKLYQRNAQTAVQVLGGIGFTWEHDAHLYLRRAAGLRSLVDTEDPHREIDELGQRGFRRRYAVHLPEEADAHRAAAKAFVAQYESTPPEERRSLLVESGYLVAHWPQPYGRGAGPVEQLVIEDELATVDLPTLGIGEWVLLTLTQTATPEQVERWVPPSLRGTYTWCQLFSEPQAGSDAAAVRTRAVKVPGGWVLNGQKIWTSGAQHCNRGLATVRTDFEAPKHQGITTMVIDLEVSGVQVRPLRDITGESLFSEVFFDDVFVPDADVVGEVNAGWRVARTTLGNERVSIGSHTRRGVSAHDLSDLVARREGQLGDMARRVVELVIEQHAMRLVNLRQVARSLAGAEPGPEGNVTKLLSAEHGQRVSELALELGGCVGGEDEKRVIHQYLFDRCLSIAGGTSEITRNVIAERILGLPRELDGPTRKDRGRAS